MPQTTSAHLENWMWFEAGINTRGASCGILGEFFWPVAMAIQETSENHGSLLSQVKQQADKETEKQICTEDERIRRRGSEEAAQSSCFDSKSSFRFSFVSLNFDL